MEEIIKDLARQIPSAVAVIIVVILFLRSLEKRDAIFFQQMSQLTDRISAMENALVSHDSKMDEAIKSMREKTKTQTRRRK